MSRYVDLDEVVDAMYYDEEHEEWNLKKETIESALGHVDSYTVHGWIPCSERLPAKPGHYLCSFNKPNRIDNIFVDLAYWTSGRWYGYLANEIVAWMPLPKPYEVKEE